MAEQSGLTDDEQHVLALRPHWLGAVFPFLVLVVLVLATGAGLALMPESWSSWASWATLGVGLLLVLLWPVRRLATWVTSVFVITSERVIHRSGVLSMREIEIPVGGVTDVVYTQNPFQRLGRVGDLVVESAGGGGFIRLHSIKDARGVRRVVYELLEAKRAPVLNSSEPSPDSPLGQIERLAALMERGLLSVEEFEAHKHRLLKKL